jgi:acyl carrier protein
MKIDSLDGINIVFAVENEFGVNVPDEAMKQLRSVRDVITGVEALLAAKTSGVAAS